MSTWPRCDLQIRIQAQEVTADVLDNELHLQEKFNKQTKSDFLNAIDDQLRIVYSLTGQQQK
jgi:hypothetical protein